MKKYTRLTAQDRYFIELGIRNRWSTKKIAEKIDRPPSTVHREIKRNGGILGYYAPEANAKQQALSNRLGHSKINKNPALKNYILSCLDLTWGPEAIAYRWNLNNTLVHISSEGIYQWIYKQPGDLYKKLPYRKKRRGLKPPSFRGKIHKITSIHQRPEHINDRSEIGHYEADLVFQKNERSKNILSVVERLTRKIILVKNESKHSKPIMKQLRKMRSRSVIPMLSVTFDNGKEFANHLSLRFGKTSTYFCEPGKPWQKGAIEHVNGMLRRYLDYRIPMDDVSQEMLDEIAALINNKPRKSLNFLSSNEYQEKIINEKILDVAFYF